MRCLMVDCAVFIDKVLQLVGIMTQLRGSLCHSVFYMRNVEHVAERHGELELERSRRAR
jgi:hypothetical protein